MKKLTMILSTCLLLTACTDVEGASQAVKNTGLEPITVGGYGLFACSESDLWSTKFTAQRHDGVVVNGVVCKGWFKGSTVRFR